MTITLRLMGGLGNQMFQYAMGRALARRLGQTVQIDLSFLRDDTPRPGVTRRAYALDVFGCRPDLVQLSAEAIAQQPLLKERGVGFDEAFDARLGVALRRGPVYLSGYWQNERYFDEVAAPLRADFVVTERCAEADDLIADMRARPSLCVHVRRGDYASQPVTQRHHGLASMAYYQAAAEAVAQREAGLRAFVFSDDIDWCRAQLRLPVPAVYVGAHLGGRHDALHLKLMSHCRHFVIANSSFSWWAAWLGERAGTQVLAPAVWLAGPGLPATAVIPPRWQPVAA